MMKITGTRLRDRRPLLEDHERVVSFASGQGSRTG